MKRGAPLKRTRFERKPGKPMKRGRINRVSKKRAAEGKEYASLREAFLSLRPVCEARISGVCSYNSTDVHHKAKRGKNYLKVETWMSVCRACHAHIENNRAESYEKGWLIKPDTK
jgi:hypothetical protein